MGKTKETVAILSDNVDELKALVHEKNAKIDDLQKVVDSASSTESDLNEIVSQLEQDKAWLINELKGSQSSLESLEKKFNDLEREKKELEDRLEKISLMSEATKMSDAEVLQGLESAPEELKSQLIRVGALLSQATNPALTEEEELHNTYTKRFGVGYVEAGRGSQRTIFPAKVWAELKGDKNGWKPILKTPPEVQALAKKS